MTAPGTNAAWADRARRVIPGGVDSPVRSFAAVGGTPITVVSGAGPYVTDAEGTRYVDLVQSYGAVLLGHAHPAVTEAVDRAAALGTTFGMPTPGEVLLAEAVVGRVPGCEQVRLVSSGTEAAMSALRLARGVTGRATVVKFAGCYHGHADALLAEAGSGVAGLGLPGSAGVTPGAVADTVVVPYNAVPDLGALAARGSPPAAVIVEPVAANMGLVPPAPGFLAGLRAACDATGAMLVFDEVITGFRLGEGGATARFGVTPDLWCFGKVIGGGLPLGAFGGRADLMAALAPTGPVYQAGTLSGNPLATAAGLAVLSRMTGADYDELERRAARFAAGLDAAVTDGGLQAVVPRVGPLVGLYVGPPGPSPLAAPTDYGSAREAVGLGIYPRFFHHMLARGVALAPGPYEAMFPGMAHTDAVLDTVLEAAATSAAAVAAEVGG
ncbi:MAG: glutamate-1-semialdehyde 2,1-aminomutase [Acidimicrobiales bacterium]